MTGPNTSKGDLFGVAALSATDAWAVGRRADVPLAMHWDGASWTSVAPAPNVFGEFDAVVAVASNDVWAVGGAGTSNGGRSSLVERWNGAEWMNVQVPDAHELLSVSAAGPNDIWAVGSTTVEHWNGQYWGPVDYRKPAQWTAVTAVAPDDVWAAGWRTVAGGVDTAAMHWDGSAWTFSHPVDDETYNHLFAAAASSAHNFWLAGFTGGYGGAPDRPLVERRTGTGWSFVSTPNHTAGGHDGFYGLAAISRSNVWAAGVTETGSSIATLVEHWNGTTWHADATPDPGISNAMRAIAADRASGRQWAVGSSSLASGEDVPLILQRCS